MLVPVKHNYTNLWTVAREGENGAIPQDLSGFYTSAGLAQKAINAYALTLSIDTENKTSSDIDKALWKQAKTVKGMSSREAFNMLKAQHDVEQGT
jgi:hypothetical protein